MVLEAPTSLTIVFPLRFLELVRLMGFLVKSTTLPLWFMATRLTARREELERTVNPSIDVFAMKLPFD